MLRRSLLLAPSLSLLLLMVACGDDGSISRDRVPNRVAEDDKIDLADPPKLGILVREAERELPASECELGESKPCWGRGDVGPSTDPAANARYRQRCVEGADGVRHFNRAACNTPLVVSFESDERVMFTKPTGTATASVAFAIGGSANTEWVSAKTPWLALDVNGNGCIDGQAELFGPPEDGSGTNGFDKLRKLDANRDGKIDDKDPAFASLVLWFDRNQDKVCEKSELRTLAEAGISSLDLNYRRLKRSDDSESFEGETSTLLRSDGHRGRVVDVYLAPFNDRAD